jgi:hypothetical protein
MHVGEDEHQFTAVAIDPEDRVLLTDFDHWQMLPTTFQRFSSDGLRETMVAFDTEAWVRDIASDSDRGRVLLAGDDDGAIGYWVFDDTNDSLSAHRDLFDISWSQSRTVELGLWSDGSFLLAGAHKDHKKRWMVRFDETEQESWRAQWPLSVAAGPGADVVEVAVGSGGIALLALSGWEEGGFGIEAIDSAGVAMWGQPMVDLSLRGAVGLEDGTWVAVGRPPGGSTLALRAHDADGGLRWSRQTDLAGFGPIHRCGPDRLIIPGSGGLRAYVVDAHNGDLVETVSYEEEGVMLWEASEAFCTSDGGFILAGSLTTTDGPYEG